MNIRLHQDGDQKRVEQLLDLAFGSNRFEKAAYSFRVDVAPISELSFVVHEDDLIIATLQFWPVIVSGKNCLLLGPIAVLPELQGKGCGIALMQHGLDQARKLGHSRVILVGDEPYYRRVGFSRECAKHLTMKGQIDQSRILALELLKGSFNGVFGDIKKV